MAADPVAPAYGEPAATTVFVQWKGTDVCLDFTCTCGFDGHFDGDFAYHLRCPQCEQVWEMPHTFRLAGSQHPGVVQDVDDPRPPHRAEGPDVVTPADEPGISIVSSEPGPPAGLLWPKT